GFMAAPKVTAQFEVLMTPYYSLELGPESSSATQSGPERGGRSISVLPVARPIRLADKWCFRMRCEDGLASPPVENCSEPLPQSQSDALEVQFTSIPSWEETLAMIKKSQGH